MTGSVHESGSVSVRHCSSPTMGEVIGGDRSPGNAQPPSFPLAGRLWWLIRDEQVVSAERTVPVLLGQQVQVVAVQRRFHSSPSRGPIVGQSRVIRGCPARDQLVPDDVCPGELCQAGDVAAIVHDVIADAEHPLVVPELVEPAEVAAHDPRLRFVGMAAAGPPVGESPQVMIQRGEDLAGHHSPVVGGPPADDRVEPGNDRYRIRST